MGDLKVLIVKKKISSIFMIYAIAEHYFSNIPLALVLCLFFAKRKKDTFGLM